MGKIRVLVVDDSALMRQLISRLVNADSELEVVATAPDPFIAWQKIQAFDPDVATLDVEMPRMDGLTFLSKLMRRRPMPIVMVSSLTQSGAAATLKALELGAVDFVAKPSADFTASMSHVGGELVEKLKAAAGAKLRPRVTPRTASPANGAKQVLLHAQGVAKVIAIGASTGGTEAIAELLQSLPCDAPGVVCVQHMPPGFTKSFAERLDSLCAIRVKEAEDGDRVQPGLALIAPGNFHMRLEADGAQFRVRIFTGPPVNRFRPAVDVLFHSCAEALGPRCIGVILTGMGNDGAKGLSAIREAGGDTIAQNEATCVVFGMPREAIALNAAKRVLPLDEIGGYLIGGEERQRAERRMSEVEAVR